MLTAARPVRGFTLIELMVVVAIISVLLIMGVPSISGWVGDSRLRSVAENFTNGLRIAQATAIARSRVVTFAVTGAPPAYNATPAANGTTWMVLADALSTTEAADTTFQSLSLVQSSSEARRQNVSVNSNGNTMVCFNSFGQQTANLTSPLAAAAATCATPGIDTAPTTFELSRTGSTRKFRVLIYAGGRIRMCDLSKTLSTTNPDGCP